MSIFNLSRKTGLEIALEAEVAHFKSLLEKDYLQKAMQPDPTMNDICERIIPSTGSFQNLLKAYRLVSKNSAPKGKIEYFELFNVITSSIVTIDSAGNFQECISKIKSIKDSLGELFYGALLLDDGIMINPLHPLVAMRTLSPNDVMLSHKNYRLAIFTYKDNETLQELKEHYQEDEADISKIENNINYQIQVYAKKVIPKASIVRSSSSPTHNSVKVRVDYQVEKFPGELPDEEFYLSAHQVLTQGVTMPYYGTSVIVLSDKNDTKGVNLCPMGSCNISYVQESENTYLGPHNSIEAVSPRFNSVCTGSESNQTIKGIRTLSHSNGSSAYTPNILSIGALTYAAMCVDKSLEIYRQSSILKD